jgi:hypothetical protein
VAVKVDLSGNVAVRVGQLGSAVVRVDQLGNVAVRVGLQWECKMGAEQARAVQRTLVVPALDEALKECSEAEKWSEP